MLNTIRVCFLIHPVTMPTDEATERSILFLCVLCTENKTLTHVEIICLSVRYPNILKNTNRISILFGIGGRRILL
jgi:hypothetical protein